jgi:hypothetical protein
MHLDLNPAPHAALCTGWLRPAALALALAASAFGGPAARASGFATPPVPPIGTNTVATADLLVARPPTAPCTVPLFSNQEFIGFDPVVLSYAPPVACPGPWAKVVMEADFSVTAGRQFDRTAVIDVGGVNLYFGTTMEPSASVARAWHVERDVTDYSAILRTPQAGEALLGNEVDGTYTGLIFGTAQLVFYPTGPSAPAAKVAQVVVPMAASLTSLSPTNPVLSNTLTLPTNVEKLYLDLIAQSQSNDEFWYTCVPDAYASVLESCGGGAFREVEVSVDGAPAGVAPVYPWIYTGGLMPYLWIPSPGVQTLNFTPYRVDLTPFAGILDDGAPHTVAVQVFGAQSYFSVSGTLMAWQDMGARVVTGALTMNTLTPPLVGVNDSGLHVHGRHARGTLTTTSNRNFEVAGYVDTSHGRVTTDLRQTMSFVNDQYFHLEKRSYLQNLRQDTRLDLVTTVTDARGSTTRTQQARYPLTLKLLEAKADRALTFDAAVAQTLRTADQVMGPDGNLLYSRKFEDQVTPKVSIVFTNTSTTVQSMTSAQHYTVHDSKLGCYDRTISVDLNAVSAVTEGCAR